MSIFFSLIFLLLTASVVNLISKKIRVPYTILLFIVGISIAVFNNLTWYTFFTGLHLTPELLFYVFLPALIFESGYNINRQQLTANNVTIWTLATIGLFISVVVISLGTYYVLRLFWLDIPFPILLLFATTISATDPVAVLSIFKQLGMPHKLSLIFEWESLFNDWTAVALFLVLYEIIDKWVLNFAVAWNGIWMFISMILGGMLLGWFIGLMFSKAMQYIRNNEAVEITLTMVMAHFTFLSAEYLSHNLNFWWISIHISGVIATAFAAIVMGNYGKTKISPKVERYMHKFWSFFAFICNSLVFLMMGLLLNSITLSFSAIRLPLLVGVSMVAVWRAVSIYLPLGILNVFRPDNRIPTKWMHLLSRGSLRWALALMMILLLPADFHVAWWTMDYSIRDFLLIMVIWCIMSSLIIKWLWLQPLIKYLQMNKLRNLEHFERIETNILIYYRILEKIRTMADDYDLCEKNYDSLINKYETKLSQAQKEMQHFLSSLWQNESALLVKKAIALHALGVEKEYLREMFMYHECDEYTYLYMLSKIGRQEMRIEKGDLQVDLVAPPQKKPYDILIHTVKLIRPRRTKYVDTYVINRTRYITTEKVIWLLEDFKSKNFGYDPRLIDDIIALYERFRVKAHLQILSLQNTHPECLDVIHTQLLNKWLMKTEEKLVDELLAKDMITEKIYQQFMSEIEEEIEQKVCIANGCSLS